MAEKSQNEQKPAEKPISLKPLEFEEAVKGLLKVRPGSRKDNLRAPLIIVKIDALPASACEAS